MTENNTPQWHSLVNGTPDQITALKSDSRLTVVSAGAGTGKTQTLSQRFAWLLASAPACCVDEILVLTFTKKAAAEMLDRIKKTLAAWHEKFPRELAHLKDSIERIDDAYISTIHAFAMKLIRESGLALDVDPAAVIMPEPKQEIWWLGCAEALSNASFSQISAALPDEWKARAEEAFGSPDFMPVLNALSPERIAQAAKSCAEKLYCAGYSAEDLWNWNESALFASIASMQHVKQEIYDIWMGQVMPELCSSGVLEPKSKTEGRIIAFYTKWEGYGSPDEDELDEFCAELLNEVLHSPSGKITGKIAEIIGQSLTSWRNEMREKFELTIPQTEAERRVNRLLCKICAVIWASWDEFRRGVGLLSLSDLIYYASKVVSSSDEYKTKFKHIMVDEFQDTDPQQNALVESLWGGADGQATLFIVGDQKQSIYRFRHADLELFRSYTARAKHEADFAKYVALTQNFRTAKPLLEKFNVLFGKLWGSETSGVLYEELTPPEKNEAAARRDSTEVPYPRLEVLRAVSPYTPVKEERANAAALRRRLYAALGRKFAETVEAKDPIWDKESSAYRPVRFRDIAVLVQARTEYSEIEQAFERVGLPYVLSTSKDYFGRCETGDLVNLVSLLASPDNPLFLAGWLMSPFSGVDSEEAELLIDGALAAKESRGELPLAREVWRDRPDVMERLEAMRRRALLGGVSEVLLGLLEMPQFLENYAGLHRLRVNANVVYMANIAAEYERSEGKSLTGCAEYLLSASSLGSAKEEPELFGDEIDAVRVMTVHASKGLEFPVVAMTVSDKSAARIDPVIVSKKYGAAVKNQPDYLDCAEKDESGETAACRWEKFEEDAAERAERERLWYVGCTRARDRLILCGTRKETKDTRTTKQTFLDLILGCGICDKVTELREDDEFLPKYAEYEATGRGKELELSVVSPAKLGRLSASAYALLSWCPAAYRMIYRQGRSADWIIKGGGGGADFGVLAHWILARWDFNVESIETWLPKEHGDEWSAMYQGVPQELREEYASDSKRAQLREMLERFAATDECANLAALVKDGELERETRFRVPLQGTVLVGATDLFWRDGGGLHLRDWKTAPEESAPSFYYEKQLEFYACALNRAAMANGTALPIDSSLIYLRSQDIGVVRRYVAKDFEKIEKEIEDAAVRAVSGDFTGIAARCEKCPWQADCLERE